MKNTIQAKLHNTITISYGNILFWGIGLLCFIPGITSPVALITGILLAFLKLTPSTAKVSQLSSRLLGYSIIGLGFGINLQQAIEVSANGIGLIICSISTTLILGTVITRLLHMDHKTGHLIASGTAICGGSAIAAVAPSIRAKGEQTSIALGVVFLLNAVALFLFPVIGHALGMSQTQFGTWCAIAIHDTSSVVGAASVYGDQALKLATTLKLSRALWIIPVAFISSLAFRSNEKKLRIPWFIGFYCLVIVVVYLLPQPQQLYSSIFFMSKRLLIFCLFLIGANLSLEKIKATGLSPLILGITLWVTIATGTLLYIML